jgi:hypothetical protein
MLLLLMAGFVLLSGSGCDQIVPVNPVKEWVVEVAIEVGEWMKDHTSALASAIKFAWRKIRPERFGHVQVDPSNPLKGRHDGEFRILIMIRDPKSKTTDEFTLKLSNPSMIRGTPDSTEWEIDPENYPDALRKTLAK